MAKISIQQRSINRKKLLPYFLKMPNFDPRIFIFSRCQKNMKKIVHNIYNKAHPNWPCDFHHNISFLVCFFLCYNQFFKMPFKLFLTQKSIFRCFWMVLMYWCQEWKTNLKKKIILMYFQLKSTRTTIPSTHLSWADMFSATLIPWKALEANSKIPNWVQEFNPFR
jgi:hypothetical protein